LRNGAKWRSLPAAFGPWHRLFEILRDAGGAALGRGTGDDAVFP
jgi:hypothetical protein